MKFEDIKVGMVLIHEKSGTYWNVLNVYKSLEEAQIINDDFEWITTIKKDSEYIGDNAENYEIWKG